MGEDIYKHISDEGKDSKMYKELIQLNNIKKKKKKGLNWKMGRRPE